MPRAITADTKLAAAIKADGRPAYQIAAAAGLKDWQLSGYYTGKTKPSLTHLRRICAALGVDPDAILDDDAGGS